MEYQYLPAYDKQYPHVLIDAVAPSYAERDDLNDNKIKKGYIVYQQVTLVRPTGIVSKHTRVLNQECYDWLIENIGPESSMIWDTDRNYYDGIPKSLSICRSTKMLTKNEWHSKSNIVYNMSTKWKLDPKKENLSFTTEHAAILFKLAWG